MNKDRYFYSEGYVYQGRDTICELFGTDEEQKQAGEFVAKSFNVQLDKNTPSNSSDVWGKRGNPPPAIAFGA